MKCLEGLSNNGGRDLYIHNWNSGQGTIVLQLQAKSYLVWGFLIADLGSK